MRLAKLRSGAVSVSFLFLVFALRLDLPQPLQALLQAQTFLF